MINGIIVIGVKIIVFYWISFSVRVSILEWAVRWLCQLGFTNLFIVFIVIEVYFNIDYDSPHLPYLYVNPL